MQDWIQKKWTNLNLPDVNVGDEVPGHFSPVVHTTDPKPRGIMDRIRWKWKQNMHLLHRPLRSCVRRIPTLTHDTQPFIIRQSFQTQSHIAQASQAFSGLKWLKQESGADCFIEFILSLKLHRITLSKANEYPKHPWGKVIPQISSQLSLFNSFWRASENPPFWNWPRAESTTTCVQWHPIMWRTPSLTHQDTICSDLNDYP